jgi:hypothetical protein
MMGAARRFLFERDEEDKATPVDEPPRLTPQAIERTRMSRARDRILTNLDEMYRDAFERAKASGDDAQMVSLDFAYRREQLYFEILLDIRDAMERR